MWLLRTRAGFTQTLTQRLHTQTHTLWQEHTHTYTYHLLSPGGNQRTEWTLCSVNFWPVPFEDLLSQLFIYLCAGRAKYSLSLSLTLFSLTFFFSVSLLPTPFFLLLHYSRYQPHTVASRHQENHIKCYLSFTWFIPVCIYSRIHSPINLNV